MYNFRVIGSDVGAVKKNVIFYLQTPCHILPSDFSVVTFHGVIHVFAVYGRAPMVRTICGGTIGEAAAGAP